MRCALTASILLAFATANADELSSALKNSEISGYAKLMYIFDDRKGPKLDQSTWGAGGKIALTTGEWQGLKANIAYYQTSDLGLRSKNPKETDAYMFDVDKSPYSVIGEKYIEYKKDEWHGIFGRQEIDTPIVSTYDYRIIPNLFEAYTLTNNKFKNTMLTFSYIDKMSGLDGLVSFKRFESMSQQTYTSLIMTDNLKTIDNGETTVDVSRISGNKGVFMLGVVSGENPKISIWNYYCKDVLNTLYTEAYYDMALKQNMTLTLEGQAYSVDALGKFKEFVSNLGLNGSYMLYGAKGTLSFAGSGISGYAAYNKFTGNKKTVTAFGNWGGYPEYVAIPYMFAQGDSVSPIANMQAAKIALKYDMGHVGLGGHTFLAGYSIIDIDEAVMPGSDIGLITLIYKAKINKSLALKAQYENRNSKNYRYDNDMLTLSATYTF